MFCRRALPVLSVLLLAACASHPASDAVKGFAMAMSDSSWNRAWNMLTPETKAAWDSTASIMQQFGYEECSEYLSSLAVPVSPEEFALMDGEMLFIAMAASSPETASLSGSVRGVDERDSLTALVTVATVDGPQTVPVRKIQGRWLLDLTGMIPPPASGFEEARL